MISVEDFVQEIGITDDKKNFKLGEVVELFSNDTAKVKFDGEEAPSEKQYSYLASYVPKVNDRVLLAITGGTYIILGKVNYNVPPSAEEEIDRYLFNLKKVIIDKGLKITLGTETDTLTVNSGATIVGNIGVNGTITATGLSSSGSVTASGSLSGGSISTEGTLSAKGTTVTTLTASSKATFNGAVEHKGNSIGFFGTTAQTKPTGASYSELPAGANLSEVITKLNLYINLLKRYGLSD